MPEYIRRDEGISGAVLEGRDILSLVDAAKKEPSPFDCVLIDDTSRFGRDLTDVLKMSRVFKHHDVFLYFVTQRIDTRDEFSKKLQVLCGMEDEDFLDRLRQKVHRGMKGAAMRGHHTGGTHYGYRSVLIFDPIRKDEHGRPAVAHVLLEIDPDEAKVVLMIYEMRANGTSLLNITKHLNIQAIPAPRGAGWSYSTVRRMIRDELYRGFRRWNTTENDLDPESRKAKSRKRPREEWVEKEMPELRIIPEELWTQVQEQNEERRKRGWQRLGGLSRGNGGQGNPLSGLLKCGRCGGAITIVQSGNRPASYGCRRHRQEARCTNALRIRRDRLEEQLLQAIVGKLRPDVIESALTQSEAEVRAYLHQASKATDDAEVIEKKLAESKKQEANLARAIGRLPDSEALLSELEKTQSQTKELMRQLSQLRRAVGEPLSFEQFRSFVMQQAGKVGSILRENPARLRETLTKIIKCLVLSPVETPEGPIFEVTGEDTDLLAGDAGVMLSTTEEHCAKQYTPLHLRGLQLKPWKANHPRELGGSLGPANLPIATESPLNAPHAG